MSPLLAALLAVGVAATAFLARTLTGTGALAAGLLGWAVLAGTGWPGGAALAAFFVSSSAVSRLTERHQPAWVDAKGNRRDPWQVLANGGVAALGGLAGLADPGLGLAVVAASLATAAADTWATSIGALSRDDPRHVVRWTPIPKGTSGGVSALGTIGGATGAAAVALALAAACSLVPVSCSPTPLQGLLLTALGVLGMLTDSVLGATLQARFHCPACESASERTRHRCGTPTVLTGGIRWLGNDAVNALATAASGAAAAIWYLFFSS
jgi:uncharacterized protein (TIGR00297 family)